MSAVGGAGVSAEAFTEVVRVYADRVHDDVRRLGCSPAEAAEIVESSALDVIERLRFQPQQVSDLVGDWFRAARVLAERLVTGRGRAETPTAHSPTGLLAGTEDDRLARDRLAELDDADRIVLLLRDTDDLPCPSVAVALGVAESAVPALVARARLNFAGASPDTIDVDHPELGRLAQLTDGSLAPAERRAVSAHAGRCAVCRSAQPLLEDARTRLRSLSILALADAERDALLERVGIAARRHLPTAAAVAAARRAEGEEVPARPPVWLVATCLGSALLLGLGLGVATSSGGATATGRLTIPSEIPTSSSPSPTPTASGSPSPTPTVSRTSAPRTSRPATASASPSPTAVQTSTATSAPRITISPTSGRQCTSIRVTGRGWRPDRVVRVSYRDLTGVTIHTEVTAVPGADGRFTTSLPACDPRSLPGPHQVVAVSGVQSDSAQFTQTA